MTKHHFDLDTTNCLFCGACASIAPGHFLVDPGEPMAQVILQPQTSAEVETCRAAMINCPTGAISESQPALDSSPGE